MNFKIHRGSKEIGGSCVEIWTDRTRVVVDIGMPLVDKDGGEFNFKKYQSLGTDELIKSRILPDIKGFYGKEEKSVDGLLISHPHLDHYGLYHFVNPGIRFYMGRATHKLITLSNLLALRSDVIETYSYFEKSKSFSIGDIKITPFWMDHSAFDSYAFLIESGGKSIFYSGDFRGHGRKQGAFKWFTHNAPENVDVLLMEGTRIGRNSDNDKTENEIETELVKVFREKDKINLIYTSGQNVDRLVSIYRACKRASKTLVIDFYIGSILKELSEFASIPYPSRNFSDIRVFFPRRLSNKMVNAGRKNLLYQFRGFKITKDQISQNKNNVVMIVRPSMKFDIQHIRGIDGGNFIYSLWEGYLQKDYTKSFVDYLISREFKVIKIHTSGHADVKTLARMADAIKPKKIVPIHTFRGDKYQEHFAYPVVRVRDGQEVTL